MTSFLLVLPVMVVCSAAEICWYQTAAVKSSQLNTGVLEHVDWDIPSVATRRGGGWFLLI